MRRRAVLATAGAVVLAGCGTIGGEIEEPAEPTLTLIPAGDEIRCLEDVTVAEFDPALLTGSTGLEFVLREGHGHGMLTIRWDDGDSGLFESDSFESKRFSIEPGDESVTFDDPERVERFHVSVSSDAFGREEAFLEVEYDD